MPLIGLIVPLIVLGVLLWLVNSIIPMDPTIRKVINVVVVVVVVLWILQVFGLFSGYYGGGPYIGPHR